jgi:hypothetical protein
MTDSEITKKWKKLMIFPKKYIIGEWENEWKILVESQHLGKCDMQ